MSTLVSDQVKDYINTQKVVLLYSRNNRCIPPDVLVRAYDALVALRKYLDDMNLKMPKARYLYCHNDESTWKWLTMNSASSISNVYRNPNFLYKSLPD